MSDTQPPLDFFLTSSATGLESFELSRMTRAANLRKELRDIMEEWIETEVNARVARWVLESRRAQMLAQQIDLLPGAEAADPRFRAQLAMSFFDPHEAPASTLHAIESQGSSLPTPLLNGAGASSLASSGVESMEGIADERSTSTLEAHRRTAAGTIDRPIPDSREAFADESPSALERCAEQSVAVAHRFGRPRPRPGNTCRSTSMATSRELRANAGRHGAAPARTCESRARIDAVA